MKWNDLQLRFGGDFDEVEEVAAEQAISFEEARLISEAARQAFEVRDGVVWDSEESRLPKWFDEYSKLIELGWPWRVACYLAWAASPKIGRWPKTLEELATKILGLSSTRSVYTWRRKYPTIDQTVAMLQAAPLWEHRRDVLDALVDMAARPDYKSFNDRRLFLEMTGLYVPKSVQSVMEGKSGKDLSDLSDEELDALMGEGESSKDLTAKEREVHPLYAKKGEEGQEKEGQEGDDWVVGEDWEDGEG